MSEEKRGARPLEEMSLQELWALFPIFLVPPNPDWAIRYETMARRLRILLRGMVGVQIHHVGSTAVPHIWAKNIVDVLIETPEDADFAAVKRLLLADGFRLMSEEACRMSFNLGYTPEGFADPVYHLHLRRSGDHDELFFRDYLRGHPKVARAYEALKLRLWKDYENDRDGYTAAKGEFVRHWTKAAKEEAAACSWWKDDPTTGRGTA